MTWAAPPTRCSPCISLFQKCGDYGVPDTGGAPTSKPDVLTLRCRSPFLRMFRTSLPSHEQPGSNGKVRPRYWRIFRTWVPLQDISLKTVITSYNGMAQTVNRNRPRFIASPHAHCAVNQAKLPDRAPRPSTLSNRRLTRPDRCLGLPRHLICHQ